MKERPILFSAPMVRALLDGRKTQTRRLVKDHAICPFADVDRLWVKETFATLTTGETIYRSTEGRAILDLRWRPSIFMPRSASRITLEVFSVHEARLHDIDEADAIAEGIRHNPHDGWWDGGRHPIKGTPKAMPNAIEAYASLWDDINGKKASWSSNPWVWVLEFRVL